MNDQNMKLANQGNITQKENAKLDSKSAPPLPFFGKKASGVFCLRCAYRQICLLQESIEARSYFIMEFLK